MNGVQAVQTAFGGAHFWFNGTAGDVTKEQANALPPGSAHPIGALMAHILHAEDAMIAMFITHREPAWSREGWAAKASHGLILEFPEDRSSISYDPDFLREYGAAVFASTDAFLASLTEADLDRELDMTAAGMGVLPMGRFLLTMLLGNTYAHTGEISAQKGLVGLKGYPF